MSLIFYDLTTATRLGAAVAGANPATNPLPNAPGIYLIWNNNDGGNSYIGTTNATIHARFGPRVEAISTLGLEQPYVDEIVVWSGRIYVAPSAPPAPAVPPMLGMAPPLPVAAPPLGPPPSGPIVWAFVPISAVNPWTGPFYNLAPVGGGAAGVVAPNLDLEHLLIRFFVRGLVGNETNTNTVGANVQFTNTTAAPMQVVVRRCASGGLGALVYPHITIPAGGTF